MTMIEIREYVDLSGRVPYRDWLVGLDKAVGARVITSVFRIEQGNFGGAKSVGSGVQEVRLDFGPAYRVYFGRDGDELVMLLGRGSKRRQQAAIETAHQLWAEYKRRKQEE